MNQRLTLRTRMMALHKHPTSGLRECRCNNSLPSVPLLPTLPPLDSDGKEGSDGKEVVGSAFMLERTRKHDLEGNGLPNRA